jgi:hypothetical protein
MTGQLELCLNGAAVATATLTYCVPFRTATVDYGQVSAEHRRLGYGRTLVAAAHTRAPGYSWTAPLSTGPIAQVFCARLPCQRSGTPCIHQPSHDDPHPLHELQ